MSAPVPPSPHQGSWRSCREFLSHLDEHSARPEAARHVESCASCAARLKAAVSQVALLRQMSRPALPDRLQSPEFLTGIYERAGAAAEARVGPALARALTGEPAPTDADWLATEDAEGIAESLARSLPNGRPPGWLWKRVHSEIRALIATRRHSRRMRRVRFAGLLAASVLISALALWTLLPKPALTEADVRFFTVSSPLPLDSSGLGFIEPLRTVGEER